MKKILVHKKAQLTGHNASIYALSRGKKENLFFSAGGDGWIVEWNTNDPDLGKLFAKTESKIFSLNYFPTLQTIAAGNMEGGIHWIDAEKQTQLGNIQHHEQGIFSIISWNNNIISAGGLGKITKWNTQTLMTKETLHLSHTSLRALDTKNDYLAVASSDQNIYLLNDHFVIEKTIKNAHENSVFAISFHPNQPLILSGGRDAQLKVWNEDGELIHKQSAHWYTINDIAFRPDSSIFATASRDKTIRLWDAEDFSLIKELNYTKNGGHLNSVNALLWLDNETLISASDDRTIIIWEIN